MAVAEPGQRASPRRVQTPTRPPFDGIGRSPRRGRAHRLRRPVPELGSSSSSESQSSFSSSHSSSMANKIPTSGLQLWLKADAGITSNGNSGKVSYWADQSGNGNDATQSDSALQP